MPLRVRTPPSLPLDKLPPPVDPRGFGSRGFGSRGSSEGPPSIRDAIIRWLNEEL